jgi:two-component sensor histidine kinase
MNKGYKPSKRISYVSFLLATSFLLGGGIPRKPWPQAKIDTATIHHWSTNGFRLVAISHDSAEYYSNRIIRYSRQHNYPWGLAKGFALVGTIKRNQGDFDSSVYYAQKALTILSAQPKPDGLANVYNLLALTYKRMGDAQHVKLLTTKGLNYAFMARNSAFRESNYSELSRAYNTLGITYRDLGQFDSAKVCYQRGIAVETRHHPEPSYLPVGYANFGQIRMDADRNYPEAIRYFGKAIALYEQQGNLPGLEHAYRNLSWAYRQQGNHQRALEAADKALQLGRTLNDPHRLLNSLQAAYLAYRAAGRYRNALPYLEEWKQREDSLVNIEKTRAIARLESAYRSQEKEARIRQLAQESQRDQRQLAFLLGVVVLVLALLCILGWQYQKLDKSRSETRQQAAQLSLLMKELHHRVKNNLAIVSSLLKLQANQLTDEQVIKAIRTGQQRVEAMALIHQRLYQTNNVATVNIREYLTDLANSLRQAYGYTSHEVDLHIDISKEWLEVDVAVPLGLIVNELVTNSFKHAYVFVARPMLRIGLHDCDGLLLEVQDNGPGLTAADWEAIQSRSFGKRLITSLCQQLTGILEVKQQNGALFQLRFGGTLW